MPHKPKRPCAYPGCPALSDGRYCPEHQKVITAHYNRYERDPASRKRYGRAWKRIRDSYIAEHPLCEQCQRDGGSSYPAAVAGRHARARQSYGAMHLLPLDHYRTRGWPVGTAPEGVSNSLGHSPWAAGQKKKALSDKVLEGNPGRRKLTIMDFTEADISDLEGQTMPQPRKYLSAPQKGGKALLASEIYESTWKWLNARGCAHLIPAQLIEQYAMAISRWIQCEECITEFGFLAKHPTTGNAIASHYVSMSQSFGKQANNLWYQIYQVVRENCSTEYKGANPHDDMMERLLTARRGG